MLKEGKEMVKNSMESFTKDEKKEGDLQVSTSASSEGASASAQSGRSDGGGGLMDKLVDMAKKGKEMVKDTVKEVVGSSGASVSGVSVEAGASASV